MSIHEEYLVLPPVLVGDALSITTAISALAQNNLAAYEYLLQISGMMDVSEYLLFLRTLDLRHCLGEKIGQTIKRHCGGSLERFINYSMDHLQCAVCGEARPFEQLFDVFNARQHAANYFARRFGKLSFYPATEENRRYALYLQARNAKKYPAYCIELSS